MQWSMIILYVFMCRCKLLASFTVLFLQIEDAKDANRQMANIIRSFMQQDGAGPSSAFDSPCTAAVSTSYLVIK